MGNLKDGMKRGTAAREEGKETETRRREEVETA